MLGFLRRLPATTAPSPGAAPLKGYKLSNIERTKKYGVAANSFEMLRKKAELKFNVSLVANVGSGRFI